MAVSRLQAAHDARLINGASLAGHGRYWSAVSAVAHCRRRRRRRAELSPRGLTSDRHWPSWPLRKST